MRIRSPVLLVASILGAALLPAQTGGPSGRDGPLTSFTLSQLEQKLTHIDTRLQNLASFSMRGGTGSIGYRSYWDSPRQWIEIDLGRAYKLDQIVLVPCISRHPTKGFKSESFPLSLRLLAGRDHESKGSVVAEYHQKSGTTWGIAPLVLSLSDTEASWIRIEADELSERSFDGSKVLELAEVLVFSGSENVALHRPIKCSSSDERGISGAWNKRFLVDGFTPYLMDAATGSGSNAFLGWIVGQANITVDLGSPQTISLIQVHTVEQNDTVPQAYSGDLGIPDKMRIDGSNSADFSDPIPLYEYRRQSLSQIGPFIFIQIPEIKCRYVRLTPLNTPEATDKQSIPARIGFAEIEVFSRGKNVALGMPVTSQGLNFGHRALKALTDGENLYGKILPVRQWMNELAERGQLESERPKVLVALNSRYERQRNLLNRMSLLTTLLVLGMGISIFIGRRSRRKKMNQIRERIAADLHDDLGANIHTIGLITDMAKKSIDRREELIELLDHIRDFTEETGNRSGVAPTFWRREAFVRILSRRWFGFPAGCWRILTIKYPLKVRKSCAPLIHINGSIFFFSIKSASPIYSATRAQPGSERSSRRTGGKCA